MTQILSVPAAIICLSTLYTFFLIILTVALRQYPKARYLRYWVAAFWLAGLGGQLIVLRGIVPVWISDYVAVGIFPTALSCVWLGMRCFFGREPKLALSAVLFFGVILASVIADQQTADIATSRQIYIYGCASALYLLTARELWHGKPGERLRTARPCALLYISFSLTHALAIPCAILAPIELIDDLPVSPWLFVLVVLSMLHTVGAVFLGIILCKERVERLVKRLANTDELTGLMNRRAFVERIPQHLEGLGQRKAALLILDLDHFKQINDTHGHQCGDRALIELAQFLKALPQKNIACGRIGGEEFAIFIRDVGDEAAVAIADWICRAVRLLRVETRDREIGFTTSIGLSTTGTAGQDFEKLYAQADEALYAAKPAGRDQSRRYIPRSEPEEPLFFEHRRTA